ncbi:MAG: drug/metabolite transporter (DMT)-like permease [Alphaproteobacteria bacterium]|jgi:drug/metabolite transporter (DMT)-like permease
MAAPRNELASGLAAGLLVLFIFSGTLVVSRMGATNTLTIYDVAALRFGIAAICIVPFLGKVQWSHLTWRRAVTLAIVGGAVFALFLLGGFVFAPVAHGAIVVNGAMPIFAALMTWFIFREGLGRWRIAGIAIIVVGVAATGWDALQFGAPGQWRGHLLFLGAAACNSGFLTAVRGWRIGAIEALVAVMGLNALIYLPLWWLFLPSAITQAPWQEIALQGLYQGVIAGFIAGFMIAYAARTLGSTRQAAIMSGAPALALLMAIPLLGEIPSWISIAGVVIVTIGILVTLGSSLFRPARPAPTSSKPDAS